MADQENEAAGSGLAAPYTAFSSVKTAAKNMKEHGVPGRIDRSVLTNFSGSVASQVMQAFKFLDLTSDDGIPTGKLIALVNSATDEAKWSENLAAILQNAYAPMFTLDFSTASPAQFVQHFRKCYPGAENVSRKSLTFFVNALQDAKIPVSTYILKNKKPRSAPAKKRAAKPTGAAGAAAVVGAGASTKNDTPPPVVTKLPSEILLGLFDGEMKQAEQDALWTLIKFYKAKGK